MKIKTAIAGSMIAVLVTGSQMAGAAIIVDPVGAAVSYRQTSPDHPGSLMIDGSGLTDPTTVTNGAPVPSTWTAHNTSDTTMWRSNNTDPIAGETLTFDLASGALASYNLTGFHYWNYNEFWSGGESNRGLKDLHMEYSKDDGATWLSLGTNQLAQASELATYTGNDFSFGTTLTGVTDVRFTTVSNWGGDRDGFAEIRFVAIPEPATLGLLGVFGIGALFVRRRLMM